MKTQALRLVISGVAAIAILAAASKYKPSLTQTFESPKQPSFVVGVMPACDTEIVRALLVRAVHQSPRAQQGGLRIITLGAVEDYLKDATPGSVGASVDMRFCKAQVFTNAGQGDLHFVLKWLDAKKEQVWLEITVSTI